VCYPDWRGCLYRQQDATRPTASPKLSCRSLQHLIARKRPTALHPLQYRRKAVQTPWNQRDMPQGFASISFGNVSRRTLRWRQFRLSFPGYFLSNPHCLSKGSACACA
jgi:hypothetical protein